MQVLQLENKLRHCGAANLPDSDAIGSPGGVTPPKVHQALTAIEIAQEWQEEVPAY